MKYGLPRFLGTTDVTAAGSVGPVTVFAESPDRPVLEVIYIPVQPGCEFQPYDMRSSGSDRGSRNIEGWKRGPGEDDARASCRVRRVDQRAAAAFFVVIQITPARPAAPALASPSSPLSSWIVAMRSGSITLYPSGSSD